MTLWRSRELVSVYFKQVRYYITEMSKDTMDMEDMFYDCDRSAAVILPSDGEFKDAPEWAKVLNTKLNKIMSDFQSWQSRLDDCAKTAYEARQFSKEVRDQHDDVLNRVITLEEECAKLRRNPQEQEDRERRLNLKLVGVSEVKDETPRMTYQAIQTFFEEKLRLQNPEYLRLEKYRRIGIRRPGKPRTILVRFAWFEDREKVWKSRKQLKDRDVWLQEDYSKETEEKRTKLFPYVQQARRQQKRAHLKADTIVVDGETYTIDTVDTSGIKLNPPSHSQSDDSVYAFYGRTHPFSTFCTAPTTIEGKSFSCTEQFLQYKKATQFNDTKAANLILNSSEPTEQKRLGKHIRGFKEERWNELCQQIMYTGTLAKFQQNQQLAQVLRDTGEKNIAEANRHDTYWGTGVNLQQEETLLPNKWSGSNHMGKVLMMVRSHL